MEQDELSHVHKNLRKVLYSELDEFNPYRSILFPKIRFNIILYSMFRSSKLSDSLRISDKFCMHFYVCHACYTTRLSHPPLLDHRNNNTRVLRLQVMKLLIRQSSPTSCHFLLVRPQYSLQFRVLRQLQALLCL
jgi:hypothetical protein